MYARNANDIADAIKAAYPGSFAFEGIGTKGRSKSFEISLRKAGEDDMTCLWSGVKKGPPRKLKFPAVEDIVAQLSAEV